MNQVTYIFEQLPMPRLRHDIPKHRTNCYRNRLEKMNTAAIVSYLLVCLNQFRGDTAKAGGNCIEFHLFDALITAAVKVVGTKQSNINFLEKAKNLASA
jgi:hypothetical protein